MKLVSFRPIPYTLRRATRWKVGFQLPVGERDFSLLHSVQTGSGTHLTSFTMRIADFSPGVKRPEREAEHSPPCSAESKMMEL
jgi:hypothetical protein